MILAPPAFLRRFVLPLITLCCLSPGAARADAPPTACPAAFPLTAPAAREALADEAGRLAGLTDACSHRADYFAYQGLVLLLQHRTQQAAIDLEKALMLDPGLAGAQLDYAQALAELGELETARRLTRDVSRRPDIPLELKAWLAERLDAAGRDAWQVEWSAQWLAGRESNLNSAPGIQMLTLTLPGGDVPVALADSERVRAGTTQRIDLTAFASRSLGDGLLLLNGELALRNSSGNSDTDQHIAGVNLAYLHPVAAGHLGVRLNDVRLTIGGHDAYASGGWSLLYLLPDDLTPRGCRSGLSLDRETRKFPASPILAGVYTGTQAWINCRRGDWQFNIGLQAGLDRATDPARLGGDQRRFDQVLGASHPAAGGVLAVSGQRGKLLDREIYSTLLGSQPRAVTRSSGRLSYEYPLTKELFVMGYYERSSQTSNIGLFNIENHALYLGVKYRGQ